MRREIGNNYNLLKYDRAEEYCGKEICIVENEDLERRKRRKGSQFVTSGPDVSKIRMASP